MKTQIKHAIAVVYLFALFVVSATAPSTAFASGTSLKLRYDVHWGNVKVAEAEARWRFNDDSFVMMGTSQTIGISNVLQGFKGSARLQGRVQNTLILPEFLPQKLSIGSVYRGKDRTATVVWSDPAPVINSTREPELDLNKVYPLKRAFIKGSVDPFTAMLNALATIKETRSCGGTHRIYDGLRTAELTLHDLGKAVLASDRPSAYGGRTIKCGFTSKPTGGHRRDSRWRKKDPKIDDVVIFVAEIEPGLFIPVRIEIKAFLGKIISRLDMQSVSLNTG